FAPHRHLRPFPTRRSSDLNFIKNHPTAVFFQAVGKSGTAFFVGFVATAKIGVLYWPAHFINADVPRQVNSALPCHFRQSVIPQRDRKSTRLNSSHVKISYP